MATLPPKEMPAIQATSGPRRSLGSSLRIAIKERACGPCAETDAIQRLGDGIVQLPRNALAFLNHPQTLGLFV